MIDLFRVLVAPVQTERSSVLKELGNVYVFKVDLKSTKLEIKYAVEKLFSVNVLQVNTQIVRGKAKRNARTVFKKSNWKKAFITIREGQSLSLTEGL